MDVRNLVKCGLFAALLALCAWLSVPVGTVAFTLQTFGICLALLILGGKWGFITISVYLSLGFVGLPVFSGFRGGLSQLATPNGGFLVGFLLWGLVFWCAERLGARPVLGTVLGLAVCYGTAILWISLLYGNSGFLGVFGVYIFPYLLPDCGKLIGSFLLARRLKKYA